MVLLVGARLSAAGQAPAPAPQLVDDLVTANHILGQQGVLDAFGHVSVRQPGASHRFLLARSLAPELVTAADILEYDLDGNPIDARGRSSYLERFIHSEIYKARPDVQAIVHCHTPSLVAFGVSTVPLRVVSHMGFFIADGVPIFDIRDAAGMTDLLVKDARLGRALAETLGRKPAALMRGHGAVIVGDTLPTAVGRSVYLDGNAQLQARALALGGTITYLDPEEARLRAGSNAFDRAWELWKRKAEAEHPSSDRAPASVANELNQIEQRLIQSILNGDRRAYEALLADDWAVIDIYGRLRTKAQVVQDVFGAPERPFVDGAIDDVKVRMAGDVAVVTGRTVVKGRDGSHVELRFTDIFARRDGRWQVVASQGTPVRP